MKHAFRLIFLLIIGNGFCSCNKNDEPTAQSRYTRLLGVTETRDISADELKITAQQMLGNAVNLNAFKIPWHDVRIVSIRYRTKDTDGKEVTASGVIYYCTDMDSVFPGICSVQRGTCELDSCPSRLTFSIEAVPCLNGYIVAEADLLGYGLSQRTDRFHPYMNQECTGTTCYDMLMATREYLDSMHIRYTDSTHLLGYSQGGASTVALLREMERQNYGHIGRINAGGSPLSLTTTFHAFLEDNDGKTGYNKMAFVLLILRSMDKSYGLHTDWSHIFKPDYVHAIDFLECMTFQQINDTLGKDIRHILQDGFFQQDTNLYTEDMRRLYRALDRNDLIKYYEPRHKVRLFHSPTDEIVPFANSRKAAETHSAYELLLLSASTHRQAAAEFYLYLMFQGL